METKQSASQYLALDDYLSIMGPLERKIGKGYVRIVDVMPRLAEKKGLGPESAIVQAARVSYGAGTKTIRQDKDLIRYLFRNQHMTPFEMVELKFSIRTQLFTARQWMRHRTGSFNEESARYSEISTDFYIPEKDRLRKQSQINKQGSETNQFSDVQDHEDPREIFQKALLESYEHARKTYQLGLKMGLAREISRIVLPAGTYTTFYWKVNLRNLFGFLEQRLHSHAQEEFRLYAQAIFDLLKKYAPVASQAFIDYQLDRIQLSTLEQQILSKRKISDKMSEREEKEWKKKAKVLCLDNENQDMYN